MDIRQQTTQLLQQWQTQLWQWVPNVVSAVLILLLFWLLALASRWLCVRFDHRISGGQVHVGHLLGWAVYVFFLVSGAFLALDALKLTQFLTHMLAGAGIVGIVAGFALQDIAANAFAGMLVRLQRPFDAGQWVEVNSAFGQVREISMLTTAIDTPDGQTVYVPNQLIYRNNFKNYSTLGKRRVVIACGASLGDDLAQVQQLALAEINQIPGRLPGSGADFYWKDLSAAGCHFEVGFWIAFQEYSQYLAAVDEAVSRLKNRFATEKINLV